jgi:hypothetical protein
LAIERVWGKINVTSGMFICAPKQISIYMARHPNSICKQARQQVCAYSAEEFSLWVSDERNDLF